MDDIGTVGQKIRELRKKAGLTQQQVAEKMGVQSPTISQWETGRFIPRESSAARLAEALGVKVQDILPDVSGAHVSKKNSEMVAAFLDFLREAMRCCRQAAEEERQANAQTQDILHQLELGDNDSCAAARMAGLLRQVRRKRREAKDAYALANLVDHWAAENKAAVKSLERLLGELRHMEEQQNDRAYFPSTDILDKK